MNGKLERLKISPPSRDLTTHFREMQEHPPPEDIYHLTHGPELSTHSGFLDQDLSIVDVTRVVCPHELLRGERSVNVLLSVLPKIITTTREQDLGRISTREREISGRTTRLLLPNRGCSSLELMHLL